MSETETGSRAQVLHFPRMAPTQPNVAFNRDELREILNVYGRKVAAGEWRDYAMDFTRDKAIFSVFRRASETPLYRIEKDPAAARRQGAYSVVAGTGLVMKRGHELNRVLRVLEKELRVVD
ncbi:MAG: DUF2794 domain-containing protein [Salinarimonadaceae bacterium]|nr:MAG: DUF2794 domain-containing protein [Salinarimonadaceae bacterium]